MRVLIIGNLAGQLAAASIIAKQQGATIRQVPNFASALTQLQNGQGADVLLVDVNQDIAELTSLLNSNRIAVPLIACGIGNEETLAVKAIKAGAVEFLPLPPNEELIAAVLATIADRSVNLVFKSTQMQQLLKLAEKVAPASATILVTGPSGCGKEVMSRYIHQHSKRADKPYIALNCAAIPENLLESELFGHEKGAFTGATSQRVGKFEEAHGGTILLDEISEIDLRLQAKLLRVLQEKELVRVGGSKVIKLDVRVIATSNRDLMDYVKQGQFREDLYYRLNVININIPPLKARPDDILPIAEYFCTQFNEINDFTVPGIATDAKKLLASYPWPGNVRELENAVHRAVLLAQDRPLSANDFILSPTTASTDSEQQFQPCTMMEVEANHIKNTCQHFGGDYTKSARVLGISVKLLRQKLEDYELS